MKFIVSVILILISSSCQNKCDYGDITRGIMSSYSKELYKSKGFDLIGSGGATADDVKVISLHYWNHRLVDLAEARILYVNAVEDFIKLVNANTEIRPYLHDYPITIRNLEFTLGFVDDEYNHVRNKRIAYISTINEIVYYRIFTKNDLVNIHQEPYEEAVRIVKEQNKSIN